MIKGSGSIQEENCYLLWVFAVEVSAALGRFLQLDRFELQIQEDTVFGGWDGRLVDLTPFVLPWGDHFVAAFDARKEKKVRYIDYFGGKFIVPSIMDEKAK